MRSLGHQKANSMKRRSIIGALAAVLAVGCAGPSQEAAAPTPAQRTNVIVILADDLGYGDLGVQGGRDVATPNIDRLASQGVRMTDFYSAHPVCAPSRAALLTGRYQQRFGFETNPGKAEETDPAFGIPLNETTIAERLKTQGYATGMVGKWHVGFQPDKAPPGRGFDMFYGILHGAMAYIPEGKNGLKTVWRGTKQEPMPFHTTEGFSAEAVKFIGANKDRPFFLYASFNAVHAPLQSTQAYLDRFSAIDDPSRRTYLAMLAALDDAVGDITAAVDKNGLGDRTLIVFTSDNGGPTWQTTSANGPLNGVKGLMLEGGIRVPTIFRWTGHLPAGAVRDTPGFGEDITATALAVAGATKDPSLDGVDIRPWLDANRSDQPHKAMFWRSLTHGAMREGRWKMIKAADDWYLFDLKADIGERHNLADKDPKRLARMRSDWEAWSKQMEAPKWIRGELIGGDQRDALLAKLLSDYVAGRPVRPRDILYGNGPE